MAEVGGTVTTSPSITVASYNMRKAIGTDRRRDPQRVLDVLREIGADVVALQEADKRFGGRASAVPHELIDEHGLYKPVQFGLRHRRTLENVVTAIEAELRRRLGGTFTTDELAELYERGTDWCTDLAATVAPDAPWAWDARTVADAAFLRYLRDARDFAGGRRTEP